MFLISILLFGQILCSSAAKVVTFHTDKFKHAPHWPRYETPDWDMHTSYNVDIKDKIIELQCYARCENTNSMELSHDIINCQNVCQQELLRSPRRGICPHLSKSDMFQNIVTKQQQRFTCLDNCAYDYDCPEVQRCCDSNCGTVCMDAIGLRDDVHLPPIPKILRFRLPRGHKVEITIQSLANCTYYFYVEARSHIGLGLAPRKFGDWHWQPVEKIAEISDSKSKRTDISFDLKPGHWYQVRVAAINAYGFRGYSEPSKAFKLSSYPKAPKAPADLKVISSHCDKNYNNYCSVKILWCPSKSNLPVEKYKIIWSLYMKSKDESLISNETYVKDSTKYEINRLLPDSSYYIQVQAMSINGGRRLKSEKISMLYNTTKSDTTTNNNYADHFLKCFGTTNIHNVNNSFSSNNNFISKTMQNNNNNNNVTALTPTSMLHDVHFRYNRKFGMIVHITGLHLHKDKRERDIFELCPKGTNCEQREYRALRTKKNYLEFGNLKYNTTYILRSLRTNINGKFDVNDVVLNFTTPTCEELRKQYIKITFNC